MNYLTLEAYILRNTGFANLREFNRKFKPDNPDYYDFLRKWLEVMGQYCDL